jgi:hypothetical protein
VDAADILQMRLHAQLIEGGSAASPGDVVSHLLAMQAQDYAGAVWAVGVRLPGSTLADVERAIEKRAIVRTWPMRGTLHFVATQDVRWLLAVLAPKVLASASGRERQLELDAATFARARDVFSAALAGGRVATRPDAMAMLNAAGVDTGGQRGYHILWRLAQEQLLVVGPMRGRQQTFALLDEWLAGAPDPATAAIPREEALASLAARYFAGHGPATIADLARWAGITKREAAGATEFVAGGLESAECEGERYWFAPGVAQAAAVAGRTRRRAPRVHLLPGFDEYMLGYTGRSLQLGEHLGTHGSKVAANGMLAPTIVVGGRAVGTWKRTLKAREVVFGTTEFEPLTAARHSAISAEEERYARFVGREVGT